MIEYLKGYLDDDWKKKNDILIHLHDCGIDIDGRELRRYFADINKDFCANKIEYFIAHSNLGYLMTTDPDLIKNSLSDYAKRSFTMLKMYYQGKKTLADRNQMSLTPEEATMYEIISKVEDL